MTRICLTGTEAQVIAANAQIDINKGYPLPPRPDGRMVTQTWAVGLECANTPGKFWIQKPEDEFMTGVVDVAEESFDEAWIPVGEP